MYVLCRDSAAIKQAFQSLTDQPTMVWLCTSPQGRLSESVLETEENFNVRRLLAADVWLQESRPRIPKALGPQDPSLAPYGLKSRQDVPATSKLISGVPSGPAWNAVRQVCVVGMEKYNRTYSFGNVAKKAPGSTNDNMSCHEWNMSWRCTVWPHGDFHEFGTWEVYSIIHAGSASKLGVGCWIQRVFYWLIL